MPVLESWAKILKVLHIDLFLYLSVKFWFSLMSFSQGKWYNSHMNISLQAKNLIIVLTVMFNRLLKDWVVAGDD